MFLFLGTIENLSDTTFGNWSYDYFCGINRLIFLRENSGDHKISGEFRSPVNIFTHWKYFVNTHFFFIRIMYDLIIRRDIKIGRENLTYNKSVSTEEQIIRQKFVT